ncbi:phosphonate ABC transporter ATP-binding protein [Paracoccus gahaiensis]|uniref:phosphonate ABC transporter ATP-binding protein n=1 Tax=Paracoccus gahaiensis TaxID=1706839 RepID=UPI001B7FDCE0|nr:phosphonate ABC transporter ATP-binding protein [Paracoccus gahaiensis]
MTAAPLPPAIEIHDLHKRYGDVHVLRGINLSVAPGEGVVLLGANGCGKSTLLRCLNRLTPHDGGTIAILGTEISTLKRAGLRAVRHQVGYVFQHFNLVPNVSVFQNVLFGALGRNRHGLLRTWSAFASAEDRDRAMTCLERVGLAEKAAARPSEISGGQQQRVAIARMLMQAPSIVVADEPIASLDPKAGREVLELLFRIVSEEGLTVLCTLHQLDLAAEFGQRIIGMKAGRIVVDGAAGDLPRADLDDLYHGAVRVDQPAGTVTADLVPA